MRFSRRQKYKQHIQFYRSTGPTSSQPTSTEEEMHTSLPSMVRGYASTDFQTNWPISGTENRETDIHDISERQIKVLCKISFDYFLITI